jgi:predicted nucleic acid-binding protein
LFGIGALALGKRKDKLTAAVNGLLDLFEDRILPFDTRAARRYADLAIKARAAGRGSRHRTAILSPSPPRASSRSYRATPAHSRPPTFP